MLHHVPTVALQDLLFAQVARVLRPGACFVASDSVASGELEALHDGDPYNPIQPEAVEQRLVAASFEGIDVRSKAFGWAAHATRAGDKPRGSKRFATWAGHTSVSVVLDRYGQLYEGNDVDVLSRLDSSAAIRPDDGESRGCQVPGGPAGFSRAASGPGDNVLALRRPDQPLRGGRKGTRTPDLCRAKATRAWRAPARLRESAGQRGYGLTATTRQ